MTAAASEDIKNEERGVARRDLGGDFRSGWTLARVMRLSKTEYARQ